MRLLVRAVSVTCIALISLSASAQEQSIIIFVADGMRAAAVSPELTPAMARVRAEGVDFRSSHSLFPTVTTANASAIAVGHYLGDTGDFGNSIYVRFPVASAQGVFTPFIQDNSVLAELNRHMGGNFLAEKSLMAALREKGYQTAVFGKVGPVGIQDITQLDGLTTVFFDDDTGKKNGIVLTPDMVEQLKAANQPLETPGRAARVSPGKMTNAVQQAYYRDIVTKVVLPRFKASRKPFMIVYWSPDPDGTQHSQLDSENVLTPGINGPTSHAALKVADDDLGAIIAALKELGLEGSTNIFVTADHGFSTVSKESATSPAAKLSFDKVPAGQLPPGFLAIDLAVALDLPLHEPFATGPALDFRNGKHPRRSNALLGQDPAKPDIAIAANGGADLLYLPSEAARQLAPKVVSALLAQDYVSGIFVDDELGKLPGTLPLSVLRLKGGARTPIPSIVVNFRSFSTGCDRPLYCGAIIADTTLRQGQGHHGSLSRSDTANFMAAVGPAFKAGFANEAPVSNADIAPTLAHLLGIELPASGSLKGRVITEMLKDGAPPVVTHRDVVSEPSPEGLRTIVNLQYVGDTPYFDAGGFEGRTLGLRKPAN
jgi:arylsulfatase A-like enzyme